MKEKILTNVRIIDPSQKMDEIGNIVIDEKGKIKSIGKKSDTSKSAEKIDLKGLVAIPGLVDMKAFVGEPGFEYKENFRTLSQAALAGGVTSIVTMPNTKPVIDNVLLPSAHTSSPGSRLQGCSIQENACRGWSRRSQWLRHSPAPSVALRRPRSLSPTEMSSPGGSLPAAAGGSRSNASRLSVPPPG